ncbi:hypothetical protein E2C01_073410 [Portunus trituberculatus]|uniref:Uncharacterized protein n=1 Tax=Portunus trituberculatus TaxID=210409 RepID=A0A5B7I9N9_PORTR|nr:hypothetical protein [Portunus trituberculatus]
MHAQHLNSVNPGSFSKELNKPYKANNLPTIIIPEDPPSSGILNLMPQHTLDTTTSEYLETTINTNTAPSQTITRNLETNATISNKHMPIPTNIQTEDMPTLEKLPGAQLGMQIITKKSEGWLKETFSLNYLETAIDMGKFKWRFTTTAHTEQKIYNCLINNEIDLSNCWCIIEDTLQQNL